MIKRICGSHRNNHEYPGRSCRMAEDIDVERAKKAEERARKRLEAKSADIDIARAELALKRALVRKGLKA